jgi:hypothetical protein
MYTESGKLVHEDSNQDTIDLPLFEENAPVSTVSFDMNLTKNMGNYNSAKVGIICSVPCYTDEEEMSRAHQFCRNYVESRISKSVDEFVEYLKSKGVA